MNRPSGVTQIPSLGFPLGAVVREKGGGPNMLVMRQHDKMTACILIESDRPGAVSIEEYATSELEQILAPGERQQ